MYVVPNLSFKIGKTALINKNFNTSILFFCLLKCINKLKLKDETLYLFFFSYPHLWVNHSRGKQLGKSMLGTEDSLEFTTSRVS